MLASLFNGPERGFTIIEILFTLLIAGASFSVLLALQSSVVSSVLRGEEQLAASMITRDFFSAVEATRQTDLPSDIEAFADLTPLDAMDEVLEVSSPDLQATLEDLDRFRLSLQITPIELPGLGSDAAERFELTVRWGELARERLTTSYVMANPESLPIQQQ
jgi:type II secretory pathway pseudopilin PulG